MILIFNGPPGSGKDAACEMSYDEGFIHKSFKTELFKNVIDYYMLDRSQIVNFFEGYFNRNFKNTQVDYLGGKSRRQAMIHVSENVYKPKYGKDYYGKTVAGTLEVEKDYCFSDGGFVEELLPLVDKYNRDDIAIVQLFREGCAFDGDSRSYITGDIIAMSGNIPYYVGLNFKGVKTYQVQNDGSLADLKNVISQIILEMRRNANKNRD